MLDCVSRFKYFYFPAHCLQRSLTYFLWIALCHVKSLCNGAWYILKWLAPYRVAWLHTKINLWRVFYDTNGPQSGPWTEPGPNLWSGPAAVHTSSVQVHLCSGKTVLVRSKVLTIPAWTGQGPDRGNYTKQWTPRCDSGYLLKGVTDRIYKCLPGSLA